MYRLSIPIFTLVAVLALAGCGGGSSTPKASGSTSTSTTAPGGRFQNAAFTSCLKDHGVTLPAGGFGGFGGRRRGAGASGASGADGGGGFTRPSGASGRRPSISIPGVSATKAQAAFAACRSKLPSGGRFGGGAGGANAGALRAYLSCLSDHGVTVPTTTSGASGASGASGNRGGFGGLNAVRSQPKFAAANKVCRALLPTRG